MVKVNEVNEGEYFGEISLMEDSLRAASIVALDQTHVLYIDKLTFLKF